MGRFVEVYRRKGLKFITVKTKVMVLNGGEGLECEVYVDRIRLEHVLEFKYLSCVLSESGKGRAECSRKVTIRSLVRLGI